MWGSSLFQSANLSVGLPMDIIIPQRPIWITLLHITISAYTQIAIITFTKTHIIKKYKSYGTARYRLVFHHGLPLLLMFYDVT
jgi:hypothetical protein